MNLDNISVETFSGKSSDSSSVAISMMVSVFLLSWSLAHTTTVLQVSSSSSSVVGS
ncbi:MAG: hypothetical protein MJ252_07315 [archaeon]|nr:hypothetical protein [archaeon]